MCSCQRVGPGRIGDLGVFPRHIGAHMGTHGPIWYTVEAHWGQLWACFVLISAHWASRNMRSYVRDRLHQDSIAS
jgi:hypothetical protein